MPDAGKKGFGRALLAATADPQLAMTHPAAPAMFPPCKGLGLLCEESSLLWVVVRPSTPSPGDRSSMLSPLCPFQSS